MRRLLTLGLRGTRRLSGFAASTILQAVASLILIPTVVGAGGLSTWSSVVLAQALGQVAATVVGLGYGVTGPVIVSRVTPEAGVDYFRVAQRTRCVVAVPCFALLIAAMYIIPNPNPTAGLLGGASAAIGALSAMFFYVGRAAPIWLLMAETAPRVILTLAGALSLALGAPLLIGLSLPTLGTALAIAVSYLSIRMSADQPKVGRGKLTFCNLCVELRTQIGPAGTVALRGIREAIPVLVVQAVAAELVGAYGLFDRLLRQAFVALTPISTTLQGWVPRRMAIDNNARSAVTAMLVGLIIASVTIPLFALLASPLITWLSAGTTTPTIAEASLCGAAISTSMLISVIGHACLVPLGSIGGVIFGNVAGIFSVLIALPLTLSLDDSVTGALAAVVLANVVQIIVQLAVMRHRIAKGPAESSLRGLGISS
ncbi:hypothetical protein NGTWS0302_05310 [Mycolicibacterium cyprinidarum]|uniref:Polysaccharide biosynthesis protein C-terminal domain-containing protein n=1 Tax=Mycolicibacterium cyprinidarum TaxID=2860311 RepID=A0ABQ4V6T1_9MYCO|nr:hypothetical protein NGTWS1702_37160 [Mycolicibacterium sp. NGTWSNA01]GJF13859.1 hypothetical protein NGTWS0302_05310 [Mycolicibacterium sp. NGTWS0302]